MPRARTALLATTTSSGGSSTGGSDRRVVFLASQPCAPQGSSHDTRTWPHHWSPTAGNDYKSVENSSPNTDSKMRLPKGQSTSWPDGPSNTSSMPRQSTSDGNRHSSSSADFGTNNNGSTTASTQHCHNSSATTTTTTTSGCKRGLRFGVYGWRRRCLYFLLFGLAVVVILNLALTLWLLKVMEFSLEGMGSLKVIPGGIELRGQAAILDALIASSVKSRRGSNLMLESWSNFTASARGDNGQTLARFTLSEDKAECVSRTFQITDPNGKLLFSANNERVVVGAKNLKVTGVGGAIFEGSIQTPLVSSEAGHDLRLESATRTLIVRAPQRISIESSASGISVNCLSHLKLTSQDGAVTLDSRSVFLKGLRTAGVQDKSPNRQQRQGASGRAAASEGIAVYQLCACADGKLFLASPEGICQADKNTC
ncbi:zeta-sarcoglycan [Copidosoma floridanum]|uniref:zeta-sarcoglycan n=1 Tax=Copidosoma floridanum TaxID=29053 RepID=UPI000C6F9795|nr:zeta-sarcoglycan [Copidosoma floridanum]